MGFPKAQCRKIEASEENKRRNCIKIYGSLLLFFIFYILYYMFFNAGHKLIAV